MRVSDSLSFPENQDIASTASNANAPKIQGQSNVSFSQDAADLSSDLQTVQQLKTQLANLPDVSQERTQALQKAVQDGTYEVDTGKIADAMLTDLVGPQLGSK
ncbi:MAG: flagellar biosynthesis anti-sigma factor FlgM [Terriglobia bacterium]